MPRVRLTEAFARSLKPLEAGLRPVQHWDTEVRSLFIRQGTGLVTFGVKVMTTLGRPSERSLGPVSKLSLLSARERAFHMTQEPLAVKHPKKAKEPKEPKDLPAVAKLVPSAEPPPHNWWNPCDHPERDLPAIAQAVVKLACQDWHRSIRKTQDQLMAWLEDHGLEEWRSRWPVLWRDLYHWTQDDMKEAAEDHDGFPEPVEVTA